MLVYLSNSISRLRIKHVTASLGNEKLRTVLPNWKQRWIPLSPQPLSPWTVWLESPGLFPPIFTYRLALPNSQSKGHAASACKHLNAAERRSVSQAAVHGHTCAALINRNHKDPEGVNVFYNKAILIVCVFLKKQRSIHKSSQTNHGCASERRALYDLSTGIAICSLLSGATIYLAWHFLMTGASMYSLNNYKILRAGKKIPCAGKAPADCIGVKW